MAALRRTPRSGEHPRDPSSEERLDRESAADLVDVPATVVCAFCGEADCLGCADEPSELSRSGVVAVIAWERPRERVLVRLWSTARATTRSAEGFFELLPDGPVLPALRFAVACELAAALALALAFVGVAAIVAPRWVLRVALDPDLRALAAQALGAGIPAFAALAVAAHAVHGLAIDRGARRGGARGARSRALRFGLYACGWDLVLGPIGVVVVALREGLRPALALADVLGGLATRATLGFLRGAYRLEGPRAREALRVAWLGAGLATLAVAFVLLLVLVVLVAAAIV